MPANRRPQIRPKIPSDKRRTRTWRTRWEMEMWMRIQRMVAESEEPLRTSLQLPKLLHENIYLIQALPVMCPGARNGFGPGSNREITSSGVGIWTSTNPPCQWLAAGESRFNTFQLEESKKVSVTAVLLLLFPKLIMHLFRLFLRCFLMR